MILYQNKNELAIRHRTHKVKYYRFEECLVYRNHSDQIEYLNPRSTNSRAPHLTPVPENRIFIGKQYSSLRHNHPAFDILILLTSQHRWLAVNDVKTLLFQYC